MWRVTSSNDATNTITFTGLAGVISLQSALPSLQKPGTAGAVDVTITGPGSANLTIQRAVGAATNSRIFHIGPNSVDTISGLTISKGFFGPGSGDPDGGGVTGIYVDGRLTLTDSKVVDCQTSTDGGGILVTGSGFLTLSNVVVNGNKADGDGGRICVGRSTYIMEDGVTRILIQNNSQITNNTSLNGRGGGIYMGRPGITNRTDRVRISGSSINQNTSKLEGGGLYFATVDTAPRWTRESQLTTSTRTGRERGVAAPVLTGAKVVVEGSNYVSHPQGVAGRAQGDRRGCPAILIAGWSGRCILPSNQPTPSAMATAV